MLILILWGVGGGGGGYRCVAEHGLLQFKVTAVWCICFGVCVCVCIWGLCGFLNAIPVQLLSPMQLELTQTGCVLLKPV